MMFRSSFLVSLTLTLVDTSKMPSNRAREEENYQYFRTTCGLIGFIVFFLGSFIAFIFAEETGQYYEYTIIFGFVMLTVTTLFFCCVLHESKNIHSSELNESQTEQESLLQPQQEMPLQPQPELELSSKSKEPHWSDKTRIDKAYIRRILGLSPRNSNETTSSENDSDTDMLELRKMAKSEFSAGIGEAMPGTSKDPQDKNTTRYEDAADLRFESTNEGPSILADKSSESTESRSDDIPLIDMSALSLSDSSKRTTNTAEKQADVSVVLSQLSLENSEKQVASMPAQGPSSTDSDGKSEENPSQHSETNIKAEDGESELQSEKEA